MLLLLACETTATIGNLRDSGGPCRPIATSDAGIGCPNAGEACALASRPMDDRCILPGTKRPGDECASTTECRAGSACASVVAGLVDLDSVGMGSRCFAVCPRTAPVPCEAPYTCRSVRAPGPDGGGSSVRVDYGVCTP
jgi:hypothetical protein